jgi:enoyl-[acyl-carrier-protein] reductase (NADH)
VIEAHIKARFLLRRVTTLADVGNAAAFLATDRAGATTGTVFNLTSGTLVDYRRLPKGWRSIIKKGHNP